MAGILTKLSEDSLAEIGESRATSPIKGRGARDGRPRWYWHALPEKMRDEKKNSSL